VVAVTDKAELKRRLERATSKVLLMGDIHLRDRPPRNCTETYLEDILEILDYTAKLETALDLDAVVWAGDIFDVKSPSKNSHRLVLKAIEAVKKYRRLLIVTGNHDISNDRLETVRSQQPLGVLFEAGAEELDGWDPLGLPLFGVPWQQDWFEEGTLERVFAPFINESSPASLAITHAPIYPSEMIHSLQFEALRPDLIAHAMGNRGHLYYGHIHEDHGIFTEHGVTFANPGAISRGSLTEYNQERSVKADLWTPEDGFFEIDLPHKPANEVFVLERALQAKEKIIDDEKFLQEVGSTRLEISSTAGIISHIQGLEIEPEIKKTAIDLLEEQNA
jgi:DNA repair exonuclease SbcCD nuclease subunit